MRKLLTPEEVAAELGVSLRTVYTYRSDHGLPSMQVGGVVRFDPARIEEWLTGRTERDEIEAPLGPDAPPVEI